jgi:predicted ATPase/DNA-binding SARP family transcriptional activator
VREEVVPLAVDVLGPLRLTVGGQPVDVPGLRRRAVLALLAMAAPEPVGADRLVDAIWPGDPPASGRAALQSHVSRLRRHLGRAADRLRTAGAGYRLHLEPGELDAGRAAELLRAARAAGPGTAEAAHALRAARALWRGPALEEFTEVAPLAVAARSLTETWLAASDLAVEDALARGDSATAVAVATETVTAEPLREAGALLLVRSLAAGDRPADALRAARDHRRLLAAETGLDPGPALAALEQEVAAGSRTAGPALRVRPPPLPAPVGGLLGRDAELAGVVRLLGAERLVTLVGPGGVGKTQLAREVAHRASSGRPVTVAPLAPVTDGAAVADALARTLGLQSGGGDPLDRCIAHLRSGRQLLVLDNCEHLLDAARAAVLDLLASCPDLTILATSRVRLGVPAEQTCRLAPLAMPAPGHRDGVADVPAVALFLDRARRTDPGLRLDAGDLQLVARIVRRLDGMPLAIELAAGRLSSLGLRDLDARLDRALDLLGGPHGAGEDRHRSLRAAVAWSYDLLPAAQRCLFRNLAVLPDGFDLQTAEQVARDLAPATDPAADPATALAGLVDASMVVATLDGTPRYRMLDTLRAFGLDRLRAQGELATATGRLLRWAVGLVREVEATADTADEPLADARLRAELANLRTAWRTARSRGDLDTAAAVVVHLHQAISWRDLTEVWGWGLELADDPDLAGHPAEPAVLAMASEAAWYCGGDLDRAGELARRAIARDGAGGGAARAQCLCALSFVALFRGRHARARELALAASREQVSWRGCAVLHAALAAAYGGELADARRLIDRAVAGGLPPTARGYGRYVAAEIHGLAGEWAAGEAAYRDAIAIAAGTGATFLDRIASVGLVSVQAAGGGTREALTGYRDLLAYWERTGGWTQQWTTLRNLADLLDDLGDRETARTLRTAAAAAPEAATVRAVPEASRSGGVARPGAGREAALEVARRAVDRWLAAATPGDRPRTVSPGTGR